MLAVWMLMLAILLAMLRFRDRIYAGAPCAEAAGRVPRMSVTPARDDRASFVFDNTYARELGEGFAVPWQPATVPAPRLLYLNETLADELRLDAAALREHPGLLAGNAVPEGAEPIAQVYAGHQFGGFSQQLGDGRALLLGELIDRHGRRRDIAFKGSGRTPFSRGGDGKAAVGPMLREVLIGEAMHALGVPTTRALAVAATGESVVREQVLPGAVLTRVAASHLRVGTFQFFAARGDLERLRRLADYTIARHDPTLAGTPGRHRGLLEAVARRQAALVAQWMNLGFIHGVMNTDNMALSGQTIDYGPCAFLEAYDPQAVFSSIDHGGRYAFGNQPGIARWNLARFAEALLPLMVANPDDEAAVKQAVAEVTVVIDAFPGWFDSAWRAGQRAKLGLVDEQPGDAALADDWLALLHAQAVDFTLAWRRLADAAAGSGASLRALFSDAPLRALFSDAPLRALFSDAPLRALFGDAPALQAWLVRWRARCAQGGMAAEARAAAMRHVNPWIIPRNHQVEEALAAAQDHDDIGPFERLLAALQQPFADDVSFARYAEPAPAALTAGYRTFCGT
jgi:serine/tyrosine/threonine adenylyltransferase